MRKRKAEEMPADVSELKGWRAARRKIDPARTRVPARRITINIDEDIIAIFKADALLGGPPYQVAINQALRGYLRRREESSREHAVQLVLTALDDDSVRRKLRRIR